MTARRYAPTASEALRSNLVTAAVVGALAPVLGWLKGFEDLLGLLSFGVAMALATFGLYALIGRLTGPAVVEVSEDHLAVERKGTRIEVPWSDIAGVRFGSYGGESLAITRHSQRSPLRVRLDGHASEGIREMRQIIEARIATGSARA